MVLAARELGITSSAVSHQLRSLREQVGEELDDMLRELAAAMEARAG